MSAGLAYADRVKETTTTTGTGTITLAGAVSDYQSFTSAFVDQQQVQYVIDDGAGNWEVGIGTFTASGTTLSRDKILTSSNSNAAVSFAAGTKNVWCTLAAAAIADKGLTVALAAHFAMQ